MWNRFYSRLHCFVRDIHGASAVEFALVSVPLIAFALFSVQVVIVYIADVSLEGFTDTVARGLLVGTTQSTAPSATLFQQQVCGSLPSLFSCSHLWIDVAAYDSFNGVATAVPNLSVSDTGIVQTPWGYAPGKPGNIVVVRMAYMWPVISMPMGQLGNISATIHQLTANSVLRTEAYQ